MLIYTVAECVTGRMHHVEAGKCLGRSLGPVAMAGGVHVTSRGADVGTGRYPGSDGGMQ